MVRVGDSDIWNWFGPAGLLWVKDMAVNFKGPARRLEDLDLPRLGREIGVGEDEIHAVLEVESAGSGFDSQGRPKILFEPHIFYRNLSGTRRDRAVALGLAYPNWGTKPYPKDSYPRLIEAMKIDETAALKSCSWGLPQILGTNYKMCGYGTVQEMVKAFTESEALQLQAMIHFIATAKLDDDLRRHDWAGFARGYNGPSFAKHNYHGRLAAAFAKWQKIKNTPFDPKDDIRDAAAKETARHEDAIEAPTGLFGLIAALLGKLRKAA